MFKSLTTNSLAEEDTQIKIDNVATLLTQLNPQLSKDAKEIAKKLVRDVGKEPLSPRKIKDALKDYKVSNRNLAGHLD
jgi:hypothetical protein